MHVLTKEQLRNQLATERNINKQLRNELKQFEWISVEDRLPEIGSSILLTYDSGKNLVTYRMPHGNFRPQWQYDGYRNGNATHWIPLPPTP